MCSLRTCLEGNDPILPRGLTGLEEIAVNSDDVVPTDDSSQEVVGDLR